MTETKKKASATARTRATTKYHKAHYKRMYISTTPDQADYIRETAKKYNITIVQLIIDSIKCYEKIIGADPAQQEEETENEIETEETTEETEDEGEDEKPEEIPDFVWEQIQRLKKADKRHTAERKAREAAERKRRRLGEIED